MVNQSQSIVDHDKAVNTVTNKRSPLDHEVFGELTKRALQSAITEEMLFSSLAEYLATKGIGFAIARSTEDKHSLQLEALFAPSGTNHTPPNQASSSIPNPAAEVTLITDLTEDLKDGQVLFMSAVDEIVVDCGEVLHEAFNNDPIMITSIQNNPAFTEILMLCGHGLDDKWMSKARDLAEKLATALEITRLPSDSSSKEVHQDWLYKYSKVGHLLIDAHGIVQDINQAAIELLNLDRMDLIGKNIADVIPRLNNSVDASTKTTRISPTVLEMEYQTQGDFTRYLRVEQHPVKTGGKSDLLIRISDLTDHLRHEDMVRQAGKLNENVNEDPSIGMLLQDAHGNIIHINEAAMELLGYTLEDLRGKPWTMIVPEDQHYKISQANLQRMRGESDRYEIKLLHKSGKRLDMLVSESPYHENSSYAGTFIFITDLTALKRAEALVRRQNWELQRVLDRFVTLNQTSKISLQEVDVKALLQQAGEELNQLGMVCLVATFDPGKPQWNIQYATTDPRRTISTGNKLKLKEKASMKLDLQDPSLVLLQSGETIFVEEPESKMEGLVAQVTPFSPFLEGVETFPRVLAPLHTSDRFFGLVMICGHNLTSEDIPTITAFADHLSIALEKSRLITNTMVQARLGKALAEIATAASQESDLTELLNVTGEIVLNALNLPICTFSFINDDKVSLSVLQSVTRTDLESAEPVPVPGSIIKLEDVPIVQNVLDTGRVVSLQDSRLFHRYDGERTDKDKGYPALLLAMKASGEIIGLASFCVGDTDRKLSQDESIFLQTSVGQISLAVEKVWLAAEAELKAQIDQSLSAITARILASRDMEEVVQTTLHSVVNLFPCNFVCLTSFDMNAKTAQVLGVLGGKKDSLQAGEIIPLGDWGDIAELVTGEVVHYDAAYEMNSPRSIIHRLFDKGSKSWLTLPLLSEEEFVGALFIASKEPHAFTPETVALAKRLQDPLAIALTNASNYLNSRIQAINLAALYDLGLEISGEMELRPLLQMVLLRATQILDATMAGIFLIDEGTKEITLVAELGLPVPPSVLRLQKGQGLAGRIWEKKKVLIVEKSRELGDPGWLEACYATGSAIGVPLLTKGEVRGVLTVFSPGNGKSFSQSDTDLLIRMAALVSLSIENVQKHEQITRRLNQLRVVSDLARRISTILVEDLLYTEVVRRVAHGMNLDLVILFIVEGDELIEAASYYLPEDMYGIWEPITLKIGRDGIGGLVASEGEPILVSNVTSDPNYLPIMPIEVKVQSVVGVPLKLKGVVTGVLFAGSEKLSAFDKADVDALQALGAHISTCIDNARLYEETKEVQDRLAESEKLRALGLMTSGIAHDFNNILSVILSRTEMALREVDDEQILHHLKQVIVSAKEGGETIRRLQGFASTDKDKTDFTIVDINKVVSEAIEICQPRLKDQEQREEIELKITTELHADRQIQGYPSELREVLVNLIFNATEAMPAGGRVSLRTENKDSGISLIISDTGVGMTPEMKQQVFIPFFTMKPGRIGLGLSMCYGVLQRHGGTIDIKSEVGEGTTITIWLPTYTAVGLEVGSIRNSTIPALVEPVTILVVEDEKTILEGIIETFTDAGHKVVSATNGLEGFELFLEAGKLDIVFTDLNMPKLSGWELIEQIRSFDHEMPIVILSSTGDKIAPMKLRQFGIAKVIKKPLEMAKLHSALFEVLSMRKRLDQT